ncbi:MAG TPA: glycoside hydrolase family 31 protein [Kofleriaceae bacterium]|nr:glycoside hydrolase family 31 protein [Kofleriaceae bacterium]
MSAGPVTITSDPLAIHVASPVPIDQTGFLAIGTTDSKDDTHYYDPLGDAAVTWHTPARAVSADGDWLVLDDGTKIRLTAAPDPSDAIVDVDAPTAVQVRLILPRTDEPIYGFGESPAGANVASGTREMQLRVDMTSASGLNETHVPVPLVLWPARGAGLFVADRRPAAFDLTGAVNATFTLPSRGPISAHVFTATQPLDLIRHYVSLTSKPAVPPSWAFAPMQWRNVDDSSDDVRGDAQQLRALGIPGSTIWIDNPWQTGYNTFEFDPARFDQAAKLIQDVEALGFHVVVWSTPYADSSGITAADFTEAATKHYLVTDDTGTPVSFPWQNGPGGLVDFTAPGATDWWRERIARVTALGIKGFKLDFGEEVVPELGGNILALELHDGDSQTMHALYARGYHDAYRSDDTFLITRAGTWGEQDVNTTIWPGDLDNDFSRAGGPDKNGKRIVGGLPAAIQCGLSLGVSGYPFFGSDIGGFRGGTPTQEVLLRWAEYASMGPIMQLGGGGTHNPWDPTFPAGTAAIYQRYARLHMDLVPYFQDLAATAGKDGTPITRATRFVEPTAQSDDDTFFVGDSIFVAPVVTEGATTRAITLPSGTWIDWWTGDAVTGTITKDAPLDTLPLYRRRNAWIPLFARAADTLLPSALASSYADPINQELRLWITPTGEPSYLALHDGTTISGSQEGTAYSIQVAAPAWKLVVIDLDRVAAPTKIEADGVALQEAADEQALNTCTGGCWLYEPTAKRLRIRVAASSAGLPILVY